MLKTKRGLVFCGGVIAALVLATSGAALAQEAGIPAQVVDFEPQWIENRTYATTDYASGREGTTKWRIVAGTGNAAELWLTTAKNGRLFDLGGRYINFTDDYGKTWKSVRPVEPLVNAEGSVVVAPNGDVLGVTWDPYSGDRVVTYKYSAEEREWYYAYNFFHTPFWDRPSIGVVPGPFDTPLGSVPYITFIQGLPHDPWYYSTDGLNYYNVSSTRETAMTDPVSEWLDVKADASFDWIQPNVDKIFVTFAALGRGRVLNGSSTIFLPEDMRWHDFSLPKAPQIEGPVQTDSRGRLHQLFGGGAWFEYRMSSDDGRTWSKVRIPGASPGDFHANAALGIAVVWALSEKQDLVYKIDISGNKPKLLRRYVVGKGDDCRCNGAGLYSLEGGHRFDFPSIAIFPDGRIAVSFIDSENKMLFPTLETEVVAPALAIELETKLTNRIR